jgi:hypothetical protein
MSLLRWNTLDNVALCLSDVTGDAWSPDRILNAVLNLYRVSKGKVPPPPTCLRCAPPHGTKFGLYKWDADNGTPSNPFVYVCDAPYQTVALFPSQVDDLLKTGETLISMAERPEDAHGREGEYVFVEPMELGLKVGVSSVGMSAIDLQEFAGRVVAAKRTVNEACLAVDVSDSATGAMVTADSVGSAGNAVPIAAQKLTVTRQAVKAHRNVLDPLIDRAIVKVGSEDTAAVFLLLKEAALTGEQPFTGEAKDGKLFYTTLNDRLDYLTKERLRHRLKLRKRAATGGSAI